jgi:DNA-binding NtrC family response regulator
MPMSKSGSPRSSRRVLVIDDQPRNAELLARIAPDLELLEVAAAGGGAPRRHARSWREAESVLKGRSRLPDAVVLDVRFDLPDEELLPDLRLLGDSPAARRSRRERRERQGLYILERLRHRDPDLPVILTTAYEEIPFEEEARALRADAFTYTPGETESTAEGLAQLVRRALDERHAPLTTGRFFWGKSRAMRELRRRVVALAGTPLPLLVTGPTGTGKNLLAREVIHPASGRPGPFVAFDCATVPESLLQAALFGAVRGAFTGAIADRPGVFEAAGDGTLFLDEIENLTSDAQKTLLTALNDGRIRRLGAAAEIPHTARVVAASNSDLGSRVAGATFRADLLMRLNPSLALELPALSERREDFPELARLAAKFFFADPRHRRAVSALTRASGGPELAGPIALALGESPPAASEDAAVFVLPRKVWMSIERHPWPGNLRQFEMVLTDALAASVYGAGGPAIDRSGRAVFSVDAKLVFDLLAGARLAAGPPERAVLPLPPSAGSVVGFRRELERSAMRALFREAKGDFEAMAQRMAGSRKEARAVRLRFNKLGLSAREEK